MVDKFVSKDRKNYKTAANGKCCRKIAPSPLNPPKGGGEPRSPLTPSKGRIGSIISFDKYQLLFWKGIC